MRYIKLFEGFETSEWNQVKNNINDMLTELKDNDLSYDIHSLKDENSKSGETIIQIVVVKNVDSLEYDRAAFDLSLTYEPVAFVVDYLKDKYARYERYLTSRSRNTYGFKVDGFDVKYSYLTTNSKLVELDKVNIDNRTKLIGIVFIIEIKIWN